MNVFRRRAHALAPALVLGACLAVAAVVGSIGDRALSSMADDQLETVAQYVAHGFEAALIARVRALEGVAALDDPEDDPEERAAQRRATIASIARLHPEFRWIAFADVPGRVTIAAPHVLEGTDVSDREWWRSGLRGPYLGGAHEDRALATRLGIEARGDAAGRLLDVAVPLRSQGGTSRGVLVAHLDAAWALRLRDEMAEVAGALPGLKVVLLQRDGTTIALRPLSFHGTEQEAPASVHTGLRVGALDDVRSRLGVQDIEGDVVVGRLGWKVVVARELDAHRGPGRRFLASALAIGVGVGLAAAAAVGWAMSSRGRRAG